MNKFEKQYINNLMKNHLLESETESSLIQKGGGEQNDMPFGGFPPIFICDIKEIKQEEENKNREYNTHKNALTIKQIMEKRRNATPFISNN
jgi:hypothetical protein